MQLKRSLLRWYIQATRHVTLAALLIAVLFVLGYPDPLDWQVGWPWLFLFFHSQWLSRALGQFNQQADELLYTGRRLDPETGLQLNRNRFYSSMLGRWVNRNPLRRMPLMAWVGTDQSLGAQADFGFLERDDFGPIGNYNDGMNLYQYVQSSPLMRTDPSGKFAFVIPVITIGRGASNAGLACQAFTYCQQCLSDAGALRRRAKRVLSPRAYERRKAGGAGSADHCNDICKQAGKRGVRALAWFGSGVVLKAIRPL